VGNHFVDNGATVRLLGVDHAGTEYECVNGDNAIFEGPTDVSLVTPMKAWNINTVRVPLNEDCWLGINGVAASLSGSTYRSAITTFVNMLRSNGMYVILDLHWNAPGTTVSMGQLDMPDQDHAPAFWQSVATAFKSQAGVIFDLYNEPYPDNNQDTTAAWTCWRDGGSCPSVSFPVAGMQSLVTTVRNTGATNVILLGGVQYANALSQWLTYKPNDPLSNLAASTHVYAGQVCSSVSCFNSTLAPVAAQVPLVTGELGESDCAQTFIDSYFAWADPLGVSYLGWSWNIQSCGSFPALITDYSGTPTAFGQGFKTHLPTQ
jgi:endoglucanase